MIKIGDIDLEKEVMIVAEVGNNHEGNFSLAQEMIGMAADAGAHAVKFQTVVPEKYVSPSQKERIEMLKRFQLSYEQFADLKRHADRIGIMFLSTPFDIDSAHFLDALVPAYKIASGDNNFFPLLDAVAQKKKPIMLSTGLADLDAVRRSRDFIYGVWERESFKEKPLVVLHCVSSYPVPIEDINLLAIRDLQSLGVVTGFSDHTLGVESAVLATALGARVIEKHFTVDKNYSDFRDHQISSDPAEMRELVERIAETTARLGERGKRVVASEDENSVKARRSIVANRDLKAGTVLRMEDLLWLRPGGGLSPGNENLLIGNSLLTAKKFGEMILGDEVE